MSTYHISEIKKAIRRNEQLQEWMVDRAPTADYSFHYLIGRTQADLLHGGLFSFKRGTHVNRLLVGDDLLRDPDNPLNLSQLAKAEDHFMTESMHIPVKGALVVVLGTPMAPNDLLTKLKDDDRFLYRFLPALDPMPGYKVLCPEIRTEEELLREKRSHPSSFASEFMLQPFTNTRSYLNEAEISSCENRELKSLDPHVEHPFSSSLTVAGFDVGKKRHPSHLVVYRTDGEKVVQVHQSFLDGWDYSNQIVYLNEAEKNFHIDVGLVDNTRGELEERGLGAAWRFRTFTVKQKHMMAQVFEEYVSTRRVELIADERQRAQITCVDNDLNAPQTPLGHGDAFWSNALALMAHYENTSRRTAVVENLAETLSAEVPQHVQQGARIGLPTRPRYTEEEGLSEVCPECHEAAGWIRERQLCLLCNYRGGSTTHGTIAIS